MLKPSSAYSSHAYCALVICILFLAGTGLVPEWGKWYSENTYYREQTDALLEGSLALHDTPTALRNDLAWHNGSVHQVWGLGVPCWRLPFELLARMCGQSGFPDRLAFGIALALFAFLTLTILLPSSQDRDLSVWELAKNPVRLAGVLVLVLFPPFIVMCR